MANNKRKVNIMARAKKAAHEEPMEQVLWTAANKLRKNMDAADGKMYNYAATKDGFSYILPTGNARKIASGVDYDGNTTMRVYIWMEGTDADCISRIVDGDERQFNVTVHLAGVSAE